MLKIIRINEIHLNAVWNKFQDVLLSFDNFKAILSSDVVFAHQDNLTWVTIFEVSPKNKFSGKS